MLNREMLLIFLEERFRDVTCEDAPRVVPLPELLNRLKKQPDSDLINIYKSIMGIPPDCNV